MKRLHLISALCPLVMAVACARMQSSPGAAAAVPQYRLSRVIEVEGRQGVAVDDDYYYVSGSTALYKYDKQGRLVAENLSPFADLPLEANHIGDIDVYDGRIYAGIEWFEDGVGRNIQAAVYDAATLAFERSIEWQPASGQVEVCGIAIDRDRGKLYMADWVDGRYIYRYDLAGGRYEDKVQLRPMPALQQGIFILGDEVLISSDDGDADKGEADRIYRASIADPAAASADVEVLRTMDDLRRAGEIEGLAVDPVTDDLVVLSNRGARIVLGMPRGFYDGYDREIHELYIYERVE